MSAWNLQACVIHTQQRVKDSTALVAPTRQERQTKWPLHTRADIGGTGMHHPTAHRQTNALSIHHHQPVRAPVLPHTQLLTLDVADVPNDVVVQQVLQNLVLLSLHDTQHSIAWHSTAAGSKTTAARRCQERWPDKAAAVHAQRLALADYTCVNFFMCCGPTDSAAACAQHTLLNSSKHQPALLHIHLPWAWTCQSATSCCAE